MGCLSSDSLGSGQELCRGWQHGGNIDILSLFLNPVQALLNNIHEKH
jgi:hypothetical protein